MACPESDLSRHSQLHAQGKTDQAKSDLARLAKIRAEREAAQAKRKAEAEGTFIDTSIACFPMLILRTVSSKGCRDRGQAKGRAAGKGKAFINPVHQCSGCGYCCDSSCIRFSCTIRPQCRNRYEPCIITNSPVLYTARGCRVESKITTRISRCEIKEYIHNLQIRTVTWKNRQGPRIRN